MAREGLVRTGGSRCGPWNRGVLKMFQGECSRLPHEFQSIHSNRAVRAFVYLNLDDHAQDIGTSFELLHCNDSLSPERDVVSVSTGQRSGNL